ncbi:MAG: hypothetical protein ACI4LP_03945, partial [Anaerovoracaceae bacterium]
AFSRLAAIFFLFNCQTPEMDRKRMRMYFLNGIYQPLNLIVTMDGPDGEFCGAEIGMIIDSLLAPMAKSRF